MELCSYFLFLQEQIKDIIIIKHDHSLSFEECLCNLMDGSIDPLWPDVPRNDITLDRFIGPQTFPFKPLEPPSNLMWRVTALPSVCKSNFAVFA
jgi:hypothetical protein